MGNESTRIDSNYLEEGGDAAKFSAEAALRAGLEAQRAGRLEEAAARFRQVLDANPDHRAAMLRLAICYNDLKRYRAARELCERLVALEPENHEAWGNLGKACVEGDAFEEAVYYFHKAFRLSKRTAYARGLAKAYRKSGRHGYARNILRQVLAQHPDDHEARFCLGISLMHLEEFPEALRCLEARFELGEMQSFRKKFAPIFALPAYDGGPLENRSLLLFTEQGYGDILQFARYIHLLRPKVKWLGLWCRAGLRELLAHNFPLDWVGEDLGAIPPVDCRLPLMSIPRYFDERLEYPDRCGPYLTAPPGSCDLEVDPHHLHVGLVWGAEPRGFDYHQKRVPLTELAPLFEIPGIRWYSLQVGHDRRELASFPHREQLVDLTDAITTFADTARLVERLDLVISCDTSVAHLAGAMGKPVWLMLKMHPDWRWQADGEQCRWYPSARLYRQYARGEWGNVVARIGADLRELARNPEKVRHRHPTRLSPLAEARLRASYAAAAKGDWPGAEAAIRDVLAREPQNATALNELGVVYYRQGEIAKAAEFFQAAVEAAPDFARAWTNLGACHNERKDNVKAVACHQRALACDPSLTDAWGNLAKAWTDAEEPELAIYAYRKAIELQPKGDFYRGLAKAYRKVGRYDRSEEALRTALQLDPKDHDAHFGLAYTLFHLERYEEGIREFEWRWKTKEMVKHRRDLHPIFDAPAYDGSQDLADKTVLLHTEQGFGDNLQFARFIQLVRPRVKRLVMWTRPGLGRLFKHNFDLAEVSENVFALPRFDLHLPLLSIPYYFDPTLSLLDDRRPYLRAPPNPELRLEREPSLLHVGVVWGASDSGFDHANKRVPLALLRPLFETPGTRWHSLQVGSDRQELLAAGGSLPVVDLAPRIRDFADTAQLVEQLDLVISCDTSVAHLAGAMGKPVWVMLKKHPDWRWHADGPESRWYASARLFRQESPGRWERVVERVHHAIRDLLGSAEHSRH
ncbi:MAG: hypothetical protein KatS3mg124_1888 [Porticoccaceae bacterium]|nr:MAG: hypothetical protein KatS3mg124_1888 [Porticoccaceae bacterium]